MTNPTAWQGMAPWPRCICCGVLRRPEELEQGAYCTDTEWCVAWQLEQQGAPISVPPPRGAKR